jgi:hypothetical protein
MRAKDKCPSCFQPVAPTDFLCSNCELILDLSQVPERAVTDVSVVRRMLEVPQRRIPTAEPSSKKLPKQALEKMDGPTRVLDLGPELSGVPVVVATLSKKIGQLSELEAWVVSLIDGLHDAKALAEKAGVRDFELRIVLKTLHEKLIIDFADEPLSDADLDMPEVLGTLAMEEAPPPVPTYGANTDRRDSRFVAPPSQAPIVGGLQGFIETTVPPSGFRPSAPRPGLSEPDAPRPGLSERVEDRPAAEVRARPLAPPPPPPASAPTAPAPPPPAVAPAVLSPPPAPHTASVAPAYPGSVAQRPPTQPTAPSAVVVPPLASPSSPPYGSAAARSPAHGTPATRSAPPEPKRAAVAPGYPGAGLGKSIASQRTPPAPPVEEPPPAPVERTDPRIVYTGQANRKVLDALKKVKRADAPSSSSLPPVKKDVIEHNVEDVLARETLQVALRMEQRGRFDEAIRFLEKSISNSPEAPSLYNRLGIILMRERNDYRRAEQMIRKALDLSPDNSVFEQNLRLVIQKQALKTAR